MATNTAEPVVFINVFTVAAERQQELLDNLTEVTERYMKHIPGFISASFHKSLDGVRITNIAQWASPEAFGKMLQDPEAQAHFAVCREIAQNLDYHLYNVAYSCDNTVTV